jgi:hypothetical protein
MERGAPFIVVAMYSVAQERSNDWESSLQLRIADTHSAKEKVETHFLP